MSPPGRGSSASASASAGNGNGESGLGVSRSQSRSRRKIEWTLATTSDPGGLVPQWVQRSWSLGGVPKAVVKDVGLFIGWVARNRR